MYWANAGRRPLKKGGGTIGRARETAPTSTGSSSPAPSLPAGVTVAGGYIYWANNLTGTIGRANLNGTDVNQKVSSRLPSRRDRDGGGGRLRAHLLGQRLQITIGRANLNGTNVNQNFIAVPNGPRLRAGGELPLHLLDRQPARSAAPISTARASISASSPVPTFLKPASPSTLSTSTGLTTTLPPSPAPDLNGTGVNERFIAVTKKNLFGLAVDPGQ